MKGIYKIENIVNGKIYIGSSDNIERRFTDHKYLLKKNIHHSIHLQYAWNKHGEKNFKFSVLEECDDLLKREQHYFNTLLKADEYLKKENKYFLEYSYNIKPIAEGKNTGYKVDQQSIIKMLITKKTKKILAINNEGIILNEFVSICFASYFYNISKSIIRKCCKNKSTCKSNSNLSFIYKEEYYPDYKPTNFIPWNKGKKYVLSTRKRKPVYVYDLNNKLVIQFNSCKECGDYYNISCSNLSKRLNKVNFIDKKTSKLYNLRIFDTIQNS
jgi:group I intron endonuclease